MLVKALADAAHLRFGEAAGPADGLHQGVVLTGRDASNEGRYHHGEEGLDDPAARRWPE
jgi:hypothetical protein